jgi:AraC family transcriptional regulator
MSTPTGQTYRERLLKVQLFIQQHLDEELSLDRLARVAHFSPYHFHRIFKGLVGEGVNEYVRRLRLESAAIALKTTRRGVTRIALDAGYGTHEAFTRAFRQMFGVSPSQFRAGRQPAHNPKEPSTMTTTSATQQVRLENLPPRRVAFIRHVGPYSSVGATHGRLMTWAGQHGLFRPGTLHIGIPLDDPEVTPEEKLRYDCCITVDDSVQPEGEVGIQTVAGGPYAVATHRGPFRQVGETYRLLYGQWLPASGREPRNAPSLVICKNSPMDTAPEDLLTDVCVPLEPQ